MCIYTGVRLHELDHPTPSVRQQISEAYVFADHELVVLVMASSRTIAMVAVAVFLVCAILASTPEAARMGKRGEIVAAVGADGGGGTGNNVRYWEQQQQPGFIGQRPRLASFTRRDGVALQNGQVVAAGGEDAGSKREVPSGPDPIHHPGAPSSAAPTRP